MKKKILGIVIATAVAVVAGWNVNQNDGKVQLSDLALGNVEALASPENSQTYLNCVYSVFSKCYYYDNYGIACTNYDMRNIAPVPPFHD